jgi:hypothetical protein
MAVPRRKPCCGGLVVHLLGCSHAMERPREDDDTPEPGDERIEIPIPAPKKPWALTSMDRRFLKSLRIDGDTTAPARPKPKGGT